MTTKQLIALLTKANECGVNEIDVDNINIVELENEIIEANGIDLIDRAEFSNGTQQTKQAFAQNAFKYQSN